MSDVHYQTALALFDEGRHAEGVQLLGQAAQAGHVPSMSLLGGQLLSGRAAPLDPVNGIRLIMAAAERGGGYACALAANLFASGIPGQADWPRALDWLQRAAELGLPSAQAQLRLLSGRKLGTNWKTLRRGVDIAAWRSPPAAQTLNQDPLIQVAPGVLSAEVCAALIASARPRLGPAKVYNAAKSGSMSRDARRNSAAEFGMTDMDLPLLAVRERLCALAGLPAVQAEGCQVLHYAVGERFIQHHDFFEPEFEGHAHTLADRGQRVATVLVYLNEEGLQGGETDFPLLGVRHRGRPGDVLMFRNVDAQGQPDRRTLHAGLPPTQGEKWLLSLWIRDKVTPGLGDPRLVAALEGR